MRRRRKEGREDGEGVEECMFNDGRYTTPHYTMREETVRLHQIGLLDVQKGKSTGNKEEKIKEMGI